MKDGKEKAKREFRYRGALRTYLRSISRFELLSISGETEIAERSREGGKTATRLLVESNLRLVVKVAHQYRNLGASVEDLISEGNIGLMEAARRFDPSRGVRFGSYAAWWIRKYMVTALNVNTAATTVRVPPRAPGEALQHPAAGHEQEGSGSLTPTRTRILSLDDFTRDDGHRDVIEKIPTLSDDPEETTLQRELTDAIAAVLPSLAKQERLVLTTRFGLDGETPLTLKEIGRALGVTRERVRQIEVRALRRARRLLIARKIRR